MASPFVLSLSRRCSFCHNLHYRNVRVSSKINRALSTNKAPNIKNEGSSNKWIGVVGLEIHAQINSSSKLFSGASTQYGGGTNSQVSFFDAALPGTLPVLNLGCVEAGVLTAMALNCKINRISTFDRKHYFYADMPAGYQITQHQKPLAVGGEVVYVYQCSQTSKVERRSVGLEQIQLEQDSGKSLHDPNEGVSLIDLNRAGVGLMEIVTKPDFRGGDDAASFVRELRDILTTINTCDGKMAEGSLRVDANVSIHKAGEPLGIRAEVKNLNSLKSIRLAIENEIERQIEIMEGGGVIVNETRSFDVESGETVSMRDKEKILDYRFMPEPNLPPLVLHTKSSLPSPSSSSSSLASSSSPSLASSSSLSTSSSRAHIVLEEVEKKMKELPDKTRLRLEEMYNLPLLHSMQLVREKLNSLFEILVTKYGCPQIATSSILLNHYKAYKETLDDERRSIKEETLADIIRLYGSGEISGGSVNMLMDEVIKSSELNVSEVAEFKGLKTLGRDAIDVALKEVLGKNPKIVKAYKKGKTNQLKILTAKVLKQLEGRASTETVNNMVAERLKD